MRARQMATEAGGTHPTGMHSCFCLNSNRVFFPIDGVY